MLKTVVYSLVLTGALAGSLVAGQACEIKVWGQTLTVDDGPAPAPVFVTPQHDFNAIVTDRDHHRMRFHRLDENLP